jgi:hypothetical protein
VTAPAAALAWRNRSLLARAGPLALLCLLGLVLLLVAIAGLLAGQRPGGGAISPAGLPAAARPFLRIYEDAARVYAVNPFLLMAVHEDETNYSRSTLPGVRSGVNYAGCCAGPMQFSVTGSQLGGTGGTWAGYRHAYRKAGLARPAAYPLRFESPHPNVYDSYDAIYAAAAYFQSLGAGPRLDRRTYGALLSYKGVPPASIPYARHDFERARQLEQLARRTPAGGGGGKLGWPVRGPVTSPFGMRSGRLHAGIDIAVPGGTPIYAAATGRVATKGWVGGYGNYTCLEHGRRMSSCYAHQSRFGPTPSGGVLIRGQLVGYVGCTGHCFGDHLHFELRIAGQPVDPMPYLVRRR